MVDFYDNADDPEVLLDSWPEDGCGAILVTSRDPMAKDAYYFGDTGVELQTLSVDAGAAFLRSMTGTEDTAETSKSSEEIARRLDGLPLAIEQIGAIIRRKRLTLPALEGLQDQYIARKRGYEHSIASVWALQDLPVGSAALLNLLSFLDPDRIPSDILKRAIQENSIDDYPKPELSYTDALGRLLQSSLVSQTSDRTDLRVHRLVQDVARARIRHAGEMGLYFDAVVNLFWTEFPRITRGGVGRAHKVDRWEKCAQLFPHISRLKQFFLGFDDPKQKPRSLAKLADLLNEAGW
jgi:hypothetical protein